MEKKYVGIHQRLIHQGGSNQCRTQTYFRFAETVWAPQKLSPSFLEQGL